MAIAERQRPVAADGRPPLRAGAAHPAGAAATITRRAADRLRDGSVWVYRSEIERLHASAGAQTIEPGDLVTVLDGRGVPLGSALFSDRSEITLRLVSRQPGLGRAQYLAEAAERLHRALDRREALAPFTPEHTACRLVFAESDELPGVIVDRYADLVIVQLLTQATAKEDLRATLGAVLVERLGSTGLQTIVERPDPRVRELEALPPQPDAPLFSASAEPKLQTEFRLNGLRFEFDATAGQKTGAFLDQRLNYAAAMTHARGRALDVCTYQGGFALHLARACERVTGVDTSRAALEAADRNLDRNLNEGTGLRAAVDWIEADAFELLREYDATGERFDTVVLDPPAFAKSKRAAEGAGRGYKELNLRALRMLTGGGTLVTCSCSHHIPLAEFIAIVTAAAADAGRRVQLLEVRGAAPDHPAILTLAETSYLKCLICRVD